MAAHTKIFVTGATGNQGGAVARHLAQNDFHVVALARDPSGSKAKALISKGIEVVKGDLNDPESYEKYLENAGGIFSVQTFKEGVSKEIRQGKLLVDAAQKYDVPHFVYSSVICADQGTGIPHWESKFLIEEHIRNSGINHTIIRPASLFENLLIPQVLKGIYKGKFTTPISAGTKQHMVAADDVGRLSLEIFKNPHLHDRRTYDLVTEFMDSREVATVLSRVLGRTIEYQKLPGLVTRLFLGKDLYKMFKWVDQNYSRYAPAIEENSLKGKVSLAEWSEKNIKTKNG